MKRQLPIFIALNAWFLAATGLIGAQSRGLGVFQDYVEPTFKRYCYECHSHEAKKADGGLVLDSRQALLRGGDGGPAVVPGKSAESMLLKSLLSEDKDILMPPDGKLPDADIKYIREWIDQGAPHTNEGVDESDTAAYLRSAKWLWSVQPLADMEPPVVRNKVWSRSPLDRHVLAAMESKGIAPSPPAEPHQLLRRLHYALTGLPPTLEEIKRWTPRFRDADDRQRAIGECIDDLMQRRQFAERWARHWLDVARYADATGATAPRSYPESWRYREYVIDAFHRDKPFDQFVREQVAGDLLPHDSIAQRIEQVVATGFISLGHVLGEDRDAEKLKLDTIDEQLEVIGRAFLGVQIGCARCHDHKIDPFPMRDYYALAGIFRSAEAGPVRRGELGQLPKGQLPEFTDTEFDWLYHGENTRIHGAREAAVIRDEPIHIRGETSAIGEIIPRGLPSLVAGKASVKFPRDESGRRQLAEWLIGPENHLAARVIANRVWRHVFGEGLVRSADNFGFSGDRPDHPELLDHLARSFRDDHRGSFKALIKEMLLSRAWQQSSALRPDAMEIDPENRLLWRAHPRRVDAEAMVDGIRFVAGSLDLEPAGRTVPTFRLGDQDSSRYMVIPQSFLDKRAIYWPVFRKDVPISMDLLALFDFPAATRPSGVRESAVVPSQSLALMNSPLVMQAASDLAESLPDAADETRIDSLYLRLFAREPAADELARATAFLDRFERRLTRTDEAGLSTPHDVAWSRLCHTLLVCNEFITVP